MKRITTLFLLALIPIILQGQQRLTVEKIMQDPKWMGTFPDNVRWDEKGEILYFNYNKENDPADSLYKIYINDPERIEKVSLAEKRALVPENATTNFYRTKKIFARKNEVMVFDVATAQSQVLFTFVDQVNNPRFLYNEKRISFQSGNNLYIYDIDEKKFKKLTNIISGNEPEEKQANLSQKDKWLKADNLQLLSVVKEREDKKSQSKAYLDAIADKKAFAYYTGNKQVSGLQLSPDERFATMMLFTRVDNKRTDVPDYVDATGYTVNLPARSKVGDDPMKVEMAIYDIQNDTVYKIITNKLPGIQDLPDYIKDYPDRKWEKKDREVLLSGPYFSADGKQAVVNVRSQDNKDRWIALLDLNTGNLNTLDRQRDEAWIAGPGIGWSMGGGVLGWLPDNKHIYFQSEESGFSHLYILDVAKRSKKALTSGKFEVFDPFISKNQKYWYLTTSEVDAGERHFYMMPLMGGKMEKLTTMTGNNEVVLSPDESQMAIRFSYSNVPWELYLQANVPQAKPKKLTSGQSEAFQAYNWKDPQIVRFKAKDGAAVPARLYLPEKGKNNGAAVVFVHGAGYLQNVHKWWSSYFREYMFHNLLTDLGYTVLDIDYRGSAGYGRDWRTGIYRHMGGKDLSDHIDGAKYLVENHGVDPKRMGIYGGSYGGFITLMAMFTSPDTFKSGAALRSVTDWAHYNHGYTSNILNEPSQDPIAYRRSSPIYFAEGLKGHLLIPHGMVDVNVHFQDVVRLAQRLIELGKDNWEMAIYPVEDHGFVEPSSWTDEYKRILKLFNQTLLD
jgi:dipeptidyl aminopeptidase/acylaminoacyl peptidase